MEQGISIDSHTKKRGGMEELFKGGRIEKLRISNRMANRRRGTRGAGTELMQRGKSSLGGYRRRGSRGAGAGLVQE